MNNVREEILSIEALPNNQVKRINERNGKVQAFIVRDINMYGVAILNANNIPINEKFMNVSLKNMVFTISNLRIPVLYLHTNNDTSINNFSFIAESFLSLDNENLILNNPLKWVEDWKNMLGDSKKDYRVYDVLGELYVLYTIYDAKSNIQWQASKMGIHDIETKASSVEVKSTILRTETIIKISSAYQLRSDKQIYLYFCRFEVNEYGKLSINNIVKLLINKGYDSDYLESELTKLGYPMGISLRNETFDIIELRKYKVSNENFPQIPLSHINELAPQKNIIGYTLELDLSGIKYESII